MTDQNQTPSKNQNDKVIKDQIALLSFVDDLLKEKKDSNIKPEDLPKVKEVLLKEVQDAINRHLVSLISEKDQVELDQLLDKNISDEELNNFFVQKIPGLEAEIASALLNFRSAYLYPGPAKSEVKPEKNPLQTPPPAPAIKIN